MRLHILVHLLRDHLRYVNGVDDGLCAGHDIAGGEDARHGGFTLGIGREGTTLVQLEAGVVLDETVLRHLGNGDHDGITRNEVLRSRLRHDLAILLHLRLGEHHAIILDGGSGLVELELHTIKLRKLKLIRGGGHLITTLVYRYVLHALTDRGTCDIHRRVSGTEDSHRLAEVDRLRIIKIIDRIMHIAEGLTRNQHTARTPCTSADKDGAIAIVEKILEGDVSADGKVWTEEDPHLTHLRVVAVKDAVRQAELRDTVAHDTADLITALEDGDLIALAGEQDRDGDAGRTGTDDRCLHAVRLRHLHLDTLEAGIGNIVFDGRNMNRGALDAANTVALALLSMITYE